MRDARQCAPARSFRPRRMAAPAARDPVSRDRHVAARRALSILAPLLRPGSRGDDLTEVPTAADVPRFLRLPPAFWLWVFRSP